MRSKLYGYSIQRNGIYEDDNLTTEAIAGLDGRGCYVYVEVKDGKLTIKQDLNGSWGIYLFRHGDYFALSNSFFRLLDHVKFKYPLTVNRDYFHYLWIETICSNAYSETAVNEIQLVERSTILHIDTTKKALEIERIDYKEHTLSLDSAEGIATLDHWADFWCDVLRGVMQHTQFLIGDLSGGFDSRFSLLLAIRSCISLDKIKINSIKDDLHSHKEDYEIATKIAEHYAFKLNQSMDIGQVLNYSFSDILNINLYNCLLFTNLPKPWPCKSINKTYRFGGGGGETIRSNWIRFGTLKNFIQNRAFRTLRYSRVLSQELANSTETILNSAFRDIGARYGIEDKEGLILQYLVKETQCRNHFGKNDVGNYFLNIIQFSPAIDPNIRMLELSTQECPDLNLLSALIFNRYEPDLLTFPFEGNRSIAPETIDYAKKINERFPRHVITDKVDRGGGVLFTAA